MTEKKELAELITLKREFLGKLFGYEQGLTFIFIGIGLGIAAYFYKSPMEHWLAVVAAFFLFIVIYEAFTLNEIKEKYNKFKEEIEVGKITKIDPTSKRRVWISIIILVIIVIIVYSITRSIFGV